MDSLHARHISQAGTTTCGKTTFRWGSRTYVMGVINVSPDSFSGDGLKDIKSAVALARNMTVEGADIIDIGGESTRPGTSPVTVDKELRRVIPAIQQISREISIPLSVDTYKLEVALKALDAGASMINDIWGLKKSPDLARLAAERKVPIIVMSNQRDVSPLHDIVFPDIMAWIIADLQRALDQAQQLGVPWDNIIVDPGIGFGKTAEQNIEILNKLEQLQKLGRPILLGTSRKSLIQSVLNLPPDDRLEGTAATVAIGITKGADIVRVHDVASMTRVCRMSDAIIRGR